MAAYGNLTIQSVCGHETGGDTGVYRPQGLPLQNHSVTEDTTEHNHSAFSGLSIMYSTFKSWKSWWSQAAEMLAFRKAQQVSFPKDYVLLTVVKPVTPCSYLLCLSPELDITHKIMRVGGWLHRVEGLDPLDCSLYCTWSISPYCKELRSTVWILRGHGATRHHQCKCIKRSKPVVQWMADLPSPQQ